MRLILHIVTLVLLYSTTTHARFWDIINRAKRQYSTDDQVMKGYWDSTVEVGLFINSDTAFTGGNDVAKRTDTPLHSSGSGSGDGSFYLSDSAKRDSVPKPSEVDKDKLQTENKVDMEKKSELAAKATPVEVQGEDDLGKHHSTTTCQGQKDWLQCPMYHLIKINSAFWGRDDESACARSGVEHGLKTAKMCAQDESNTMVKVQNACDGESACELVASPVYFDRTDCPDVYKFLRVNWECAHSESRVKDVLPDSGKTR